MLIISFLFSVMLISLYIVLKIFEPQFKVKKRIDVFVNSNRQDEKKDVDEGRVALKKGLFFLRSKVKGYFEGRLSSSKEQSLDRKLLQAGKPFGMTPIDFQMLKIILNIALPVLFGLLGKITGTGYTGIGVCILIGLVLSFFIPDFYLNLKIKQRQREALKELPDFLDLLTVCLEAGLGFDGALNKVISKRAGILSAEFHICLEEIRLGKTRKEALTEVKERLGFDELKSLINSILQAEKLGISIVQILRIKSQEEREKRRQRAEEEAMKAPIKILFPLVIFIFPSIFIVLLGPAIIQLLTTLNK